MKVYRVRPNYGDDNVYIQHTGFDKDIVFDNIEGKKINEIKTFDFVLKRKTKKYPDLLGTGSSEFFVSNELKNFLEKHIKNQEINFIEFVFGKKQYWFLNIVGLRNCMDYQKSVYTKFENNNPDRITNLVINEEEIDEYDIFRLKDKPVPVFITDAVKRKLKEMNFTGIEFIQGIDLTSFFQIQNNKT